MDTFPFLEEPADLYVEADVEKIEEQIDAMWTDEESTEIWEWNHVFSQQDRNADYKENEQVEKEEEKLRKRVLRQFLKNQTRNVSRLVRKVMNGMPEVENDVLRKMRTDLTMWHRKRREEGDKTRDLETELRAYMWDNLRATGMQIPSIYESQPQRLQA